MCVCVLCCRLLVRFAKRNSRPRPIVHVPKLPVLLRQHIRMGDDRNAIMERHHSNYQREDGYRYSKRDNALRPFRQILLHELQLTRQDLHDIVPRVAERPHESAHVSAGDVAVGTC